VTVERPEFRISDTEREEAIEALGTHMRDGRLDIDEYGDRTARVTTAKTRGELVTLFSDLPEPRPATLRQQPPEPARPHAPRRRPSWVLPVGIVPIAVIALVGVALLTRGIGVMVLIPVVLLIAGACGGRCWPGRR